MSDAVARHENRFEDIDRLGDRRDTAAYLSHAWKLQQWRAGEVFGLMNLHRGSRVLDAGCGAGNQLNAFQRAEPAALLFGVDRSVGMLQTAASLVDASISLGQALVEWLPFADDSFDRVHVERVLVHVEDPHRALGEFRRVLCPGGRLVAIEPDTPAIAIASSYPDISRHVVTYIAENLRNPAIGENLPSMVAAAGFDLGCCKRWCGETASLEDADRFLRLCSLAARAAADGAINAGDIDRWADDLEARDAAGTFEVRWSVTAVLGTPLTERRRKQL